jgi:hypothetical protein
MSSQVQTTNRVDPHRDFRNYCLTALIRGGEFRQSTVDDLCNILTHQQQRTIFRELYGTEPGASQREKLCEIILSRLVEDEDFDRYVHMVSDKLHQEVNVEHKSPTELAEDLFEAIFAQRRDLVLGPRRGHRDVVAPCKKHRYTMGNMSKGVLYTLLLALIFLVASPFFQGVPHWQSSSTHPGPITDQAVKHAVMVALETDDAKAYETLYRLIPEDHELALGVAVLAGHIPVPRAKKEWLSLSRETHPDRHRTYKQFWDKVQMRVNSKQ